VRAHVIGIAGSGKTTLARKLAHRYGMAAIDLDDVAYDRALGERSEPDVIALIDDIRGRPGWVTEGAYRNRWIEPLLADADRIIWLDVPVATCAFRMVRRHVIAELRRSNAHSGWLRLVSFIDYTRRTAATQRAETERLLAPHAAKVVRRRSSGQHAKVLREFGSDWAR
jgi:adenylate kinase family enzyme